MEPTNAPAKPQFSEAAKAEIDRICKQYPAERRKSAMLPVLHIAQAEFGGWELSRVRLYTDGSRRVLLKRKKTAHHVPEPGI